MSTIDITLVCCSKPSCFFIATLLKRNLTGNTCRTVDPKSRGGHSYELIQHSLCLVLCTCSHIIKDLCKLVKNLNRLSDSYGHGKILVLGSHKNKQELSNFRNLNPEYIEDCVTVIQETVSQNYVNSNEKSQNPYEDIRSVKSHETNLGISSIHETELKGFYPTSLAGTAAGEDMKKVNLTKNVRSLRESFINAQTLDPYEDNHGVYALEWWCKSKDTFKLSPVSLTDYFNHSSDDERIEIRKYILTSVIPSLKEQHDFNGICAFVGCEDYHIQLPVIETLNILLIESDFTKLHVDIISDGLDMCFHLLDRKSSDQMLIKCLYPVILSAFAVLYLKTTNKEGGLVFQNQLLQLSKRYININSELKSLKHQNIILGDLLASLHQQLNTLNSHIGKRSCLQMGNWKEALSIEENRENLRRNIKTMSYIEQYSCILGIMNQYLQGDSVLSRNINGLLKYSIQIIFEAAVGKKLKHDTTLYPLLLLTTKGLSRFLQTKVFPEGSKEIFDILDIYLDSPKFCQMRRRSILEELNNLLCLSDRAVVTKIIYLFGRNGIESYDIRQKVKKYIEKILQLTCLKITSQNDSISTDLTPQWCQFDAQMCGTRHVTLHALLPTLHCLAQGSMENYKLKADQHKTKIRINTLETLRHLQEKGLHPNVISLLVYQIRPLPLFYIVNRVGDSSLYSFLIQRRCDRKWLSPTELVLLVADSVSAIVYLHQQKVINRDITTHSFNIVDNVNHRKVVLTSLNIARILDNPSRINHSHASDLSDNLIPARWSAPESILDDLYDTKSDTYMFGHFIQEIFTHGCQPYTELFNISTEQVLTWVVFHDLPPRQWPCIPKKIHEIILKCVCPEPDNRIDLKTMPALLNEFIESTYDVNGRHKTFRPFEDDKIYPELQCETKPERGLTPLFIGLKQSNENPRKSYFNLKKSKRKVKTQIELNQNDLLSPDQPSIKSNGIFLKITEPVSKRYVETMLPKLNKDVLSVLHVERSIEKVRGVHGSTEEFFFTLRYKCTNGMNLYDIASKCHFGNPLEKSNKIKYLSVVYGLAEYISSLHDFDFIHRDIQCKFLYFSLENNQIICPRIGRMLYIPPTIIDDSILEGVFEDNKNWMPIEVLHGGQYSKESDTYMFGMAVYEFYTALSIRRDNPMASDIECVPFCKVKRKQLLEHLYGGERLYQPEHCPDWLFDIIINCWDRDRTRRPSMKTILKQIHKQFQSLPSGTMSSTEEYPNSDSEFGIYSTDDSSLEDGNQQSNSPISIPQIFNSRLGLNFYRPKSTVDISPTGNFRTPTKESSESENDSSWPKSTRKPSFEEPRIKSLNGLDKTRSKSTSNLPNKSCVKQKSVKFKNRVTFNHLLFDNDSEKRLLSNSYEENVDTQNINDKYCQKSEELIPELQIHVAKNDKNTTFEDNSKQCLNGNTKDDQRLSKDKKLGEGNRSSFNATESRKSSFSCINDSFSSSDIEFQQYRINSLKVTSDSSFKSKPPPKCNHLPKDDVTNMTSDQCVKKKPVNFPCGNHRSSRIPCINSSSSSEDTNVNSSNTNGFSTESRSLTVGVNSADQHNLTATTSQGSILRNTIKNFFSNFSKYNHNKKDDEETSDYLTPIW